MKNKLIGMAILVGVLVLVSVWVRYQIKRPTRMETVTNIAWQGDDSKDSLGRKYLEKDKQGNEVLAFTWSGTARDDQSLWILDSKKGAIDSTARYYAIVGQVKYAKLQGWKLMASSIYSTPEEDERTTQFGVADDNFGLSRSLSGNSDWRDFVIPFGMVGGDGTWQIKRVLFRMFMVNPGTLYLRNVRLVKFPDLTVEQSESLYKAMRNSNTVDEMLMKCKSAKNWWPVWWGGWIGSIVGVFLGLMGCVLGILSSMEKGWRFILISLWGLNVIGAISLISGLVAVALGQPYDIYFVLLLVGGISVLVWPVNLWQFLRKRHQHELRRMESLDIF